ncbi:MAG: TRAP transporter large permease [Thermodesulfobacteriota bacterium]
MDPNILGLIVIGVLFLALFSGMPIAFGLGVPSIVFMYLFLDSAQFDMTALIMFDGVNDFGLLAIPLFIFMGAIVAVTPTGSDLYEGIHRWVYKLPGGLAMSNVLACGLFSALCGSSPATAAAIGTMGIPEMQKRGYPDSLAAGSIVGGGALGNLIPPGVVPIVYGLATQTSIGKLFIGSVIPGIIVTVLMCVWVAIYSWWARRQMGLVHADTGRESGREFYGKITYSLRERLQGILKVAPFMILVVFLLIVLYGGYATPSEAAGVSSIATLVMAVAIYRLFSFDDYRRILEMTVRESTMIMLIIATSFLFTTLLTKLYITQAITQSLVALEFSKLGLMIMINIFLLVLGCLLPPVAIVLIACPILHPVIVAYGFDPVWFGIIITINMEVGMITPPFGLNLFIVKGIAPDIPLERVLFGSLPFAICLIMGIVLCYIWPELVLWLPNQMIR